MARKATKTTKPEIIEEESQTKNSLFDYFRFGESYTSLILGIIVVIISTVLLLSFVHNRNVAKNDTPQLLSQKDIRLPSIAALTGEPSSEVTKEVPTAAPTAVPTKAAPTKKAEPTKIVAQAKTTPAPEKKVEQGNTKPVKGEYTVAAGDNLWVIAEKQYKSGYNWVDIARANNLSNPGMITAGQKLKLPNVEQKIATVSRQQNEAKEAVSQPTFTKITGDNYAVAKGDTLWNISVRAYGDGYQWVEIASANNFQNPTLSTPETSSPSRKKNNPFFPYTPNPHISLIFYFFCYNLYICGVSTPVVCYLPKVEKRVQFSYPAHNLQIQVFES